jgi:hypothetical protein
MPDNLKSIIPKKYHALISPSLRRVFLDAQEDNSPAVIENLNAEIAALKKLVSSLSLLVDDALELNHLRASSRISCEEPASTSWVKTGLTLFFFPVFIFMKLYSLSVGRQ